MWWECPLGGNIGSGAIYSLRELGLLHLVSDGIYIPGTGQVPDLCTNTVTAVVSLAGGGLTSLGEPGRSMMGNIL